MRVDPVALAKLRALTDGQEVSGVWDSGGGTCTVTRDGRWFVVNFLPSSTWQAATGDYPPERAFLSARRALEHLNDYGADI